MNQLQNLVIRPSGELQLSHGGFHHILHSIIEDAIFTNLNWVHISITEYVVPANRSLRICLVFSTLNWSALFTDAVVIRLFIIQRKGLQAYVNAVQQMHCRAFLVFGDDRFNVDDDDSQTNDSAGIDLGNH